MGEWANNSHSAADVPIRLGNIQLQERYEL